MDGGIRPSTFDLPMFDGKNLKQWLCKCDQFFSLNNTPPESCVMLASMHLVGDARQWHEKYMRARYQQTPFWYEYIIDISFRFPDNNHFSCESNGCARRECSYIDDVTVNSQLAGQNTCGVFAGDVFGEVLRGNHSDNPKLLADVLEHDLVMMKTRTPIDEGGVTVEDKQIEDEENSSFDAHDVLDEMHVTTQGNGGEVHQLVRMDEFDNVVHKVFGKKPGDHDWGLAVDNCVDVIFAELGKVENVEHQAVGKKATYNVANDLFDELPVKHISPLKQLIPDFSYHTMLDGGKYMDLAFVMFDPGGLWLLVSSRKMKEGSNLASVVCNIHELCITLSDRCLRAVNGVNKFVLNATDEKDCTWRKKSLNTNRGSSGADDWKGNCERPARVPMSSDGSRSSLFTVTQQCLDLFTPEKQDVLPELGQIMQSLRRVEHQKGYAYGDSVPGEDQSFTLDNVHSYHHPDRDAELG